MKQGLLLVLSVVLLGACSEQTNDRVQIETREAAPVARDNMVSQSEAQQQLSGAALYAIACQACHSIEAGTPHRVGPNLNGILGKAAASRTAYIYSTALQESGLVWNKANLTAWIATPESLVPGTWMLYHNILAGEEVSRVIDFIEQAAASDQS